VFVYLNLLTAFENLRFVITLNKKFLKHIQNKQKSISENQYHPTDFKNLKKKIRKKSLKILVFTLLIRGKDKRKRAL
jgi:hypothetical protein